MSIYSNLGGIVVVSVICCVSLLLFYLSQYILYTGKVDVNKRKLIHSTYTNIFFVLIFVVNILICVYHVHTVQQFKSSLCRTTYLANTESLLADRQTQADYVEGLKSASSKIDRSKLTKEELDYINSCPRASLTFESWEDYFNEHFKSSTNPSSEAQDLWVEWVSDSYYYGTLWN